MDATATCLVAQAGTGTIRTSGLRGLAQGHQARLGDQMAEGQAKRAHGPVVLANGVVISCVITPVITRSVRGRRFGTVAEPAKEPERAFA